jgi:carbon storage regulator CsrA
MLNRDYISAKKRMAVFQSERQGVWHRLRNWFTRNNRKINHTTYKKKNLSMLIVHRNPGQSIWIGEDIQIIIFGHSANSVRIGIEAPPKIKILRGELKQKEPSYQND